MRFTRWWNPSLPQMLGIAQFLLYAEAVFTFIGLLGLPLGGSAYIFLAPLLYGHVNSISGLEHVNGIVNLVILLSGVAYAFAGLGIANGQKIGWRVGVVVAAGAVILPIAAGGLRLVIGSEYILTFIFSVALLALLLHPESREHQRIWFDGSTRTRRRR
jgi:hypothetical protein